MSRWGTAIWGTSTWPSLTVASLLQQPPSTSHGVPSGLGDWRFSVEILLPLDGTAIWGVATWGDSAWNVLGWVDITEWMRGLAWERGSDEPYGRPRVGELTLTLDSTGDRWNPWNPTPPSGSPAYFSCGTIIRVGLRSATDTRANGWIPQITAIVDEWSPEYVQGNADRYVDVTAVETLRDLATIDDNALTGVVGGGEDPVVRMERLLDAAQWKYGLRVEAQQILFAPASYPLQSTDMANNRLAECYLVGDSCDAQVRTDRTGALLMTNIEYIGTDGPADADILPLFDFSNDGVSPYIGFDYYERTLSDVRYVPYDLDSFHSTNSDDSVINDVRFARVGGTQQVFEQLASIERYGRRTLVRNDLIVNSDLVALQIAQYTSIRRALNTLRVNNVTVQVTDRGTEAGLVTAAADIQSKTRVFPPDGGTGDGSPRPYINGYIASMRHEITARNPTSISWVASFGIDTRTVNRIPAAQLPATPA